MNGPIRLAPCATCAGTGEDFQVCPNCDGIGFEYTGGLVEKCDLCCGTPTVWVKCPACQGDGTQIRADLELFARAVSMPSRHRKRRGF